MQNFKNVIIIIISKNYPSKVFLHFVAAAMFHQSQNQCLSPPLNFWVNISECHFEKRVDLYDLWIFPYKVAAMHTLVTRHKN